MQRVTGVPMEARTAVGTLRRAERALFPACRLAAASCARRARSPPSSACRADEVQVVARDIGGNFGTKNSIFPEFPLVLWACAPARPAGEMGLRAQRSLHQRLSGPRPCRQGRARARQARQVPGDARLASQQHRRLRGFHRAAAQRGDASSPASTACRSRIIRRSRCVTNTPPTTPYRSAGRPEATFIMERLCDLAAAKTGIDRIEIRRRNLIAPDELPYRTAFGVTYDNGELRSRDGHRRARSRTGPTSKSAAPKSKKRGKLRGIGLANYIECTMGYPREWSKITVTAGRRGRGRGRHAVERAGPRDELRAMRERMARRAVRAGAAGAGRYRYRPGRRRLAFRPVHADGGLRHGQGRRRRHRTQPRIAAHMLQVEPRQVEFSRTVALRRRVGQRARSTCSRSRSAARTLNDLTDDLRGAAGGGMRPHVHGRRLSVWLRGLRGRDRPADRHDGNRALLPPSTTSGAPSIR